MSAELAKGKTGSLHGPGRLACTEETTPLRRVGDAAGKYQIGVLGGLCVAYAFCILPVGLGPGLLPALEEDPKLGWSPTTSGLYTGASMWAVAFGSLTIGWLPDYLPNTVVLMMYVVVASLVLHAMSFAQSAAALISLHALTFTMKSVTWPAAMSIMGTHLANFKVELGILFVGLFSRLSSVGSSMLMGNLLLHLNWRTALEVVAIICLCAVVFFRLVIRVSNMDHLLEKLAAAREVAEAPNESGQELVAVPAQQHASSFSDVVGYAMKLFADRTFLLLISFAMGLELSLGLLIFFSNFMHSIYNAPVAESAILSGVMNMGEVLTLCLGIALILLGVKRSALFDIILVQLCIGVLATLTIIFFTTSFHGFFFLATILGFSVTLGGYLVAPLHCIEMAKVNSLGDIATRVAVVDGLSTLVGATSRFCIGLQRDVDESRGLMLAASFACIGTVTMAISLFVLSRYPPGGSSPDGLPHTD